MARRLSLASALLLLGGCSDAGRPDLLGREAALDADHTPDPDADRDAGASLDAEGWGELHPTWRQMTREGRWHEMGALVTDEMLERFAVVGEPKDIAEKLVARFGDWADRLSLMTTYLLAPEVASEIVSGVQRLTASRSR